MDNENKALGSACGQTCSEILPARYDPAAVETWLEDMAKDGWQLTGFDYRFFRTAPRRASGPAAPAPCSDRSPPPAVPR